MDSATYGFGPGGVSRRGIPAGSTPWARAAQSWNPLPNVETSDPHDGPLVAEVGDGPPATGPVPDNIVCGDVGTVAATFADNSADDFGVVPDNIVAE